MQKRADIERLTEIPLWISNLTFAIVNMSNSRIIKITSSNNTLYMKLSTVLHFFDFDNCINHMYFWLCENTYTVTEKFKLFVEVIQRDNISDADNAAKVIRDSVMFNSESLINCELVTCAVHNIIHNYFNK